jgi:hypothetical protein
MFAITPFERIDAAQEYLVLLNETVTENKRKIDAALMEMTIQTSPSYVQALKLASHNLENLDNHLRASGRSLNNLRKLRGLLVNENVANSKLDQPSEVAAQRDAHSVETQLVA